MSSYRGFLGKIYSIGKYFPEAIGVGSFFKRPMPGARIITNILHMITSIFGWEDGGERCKIQAPVNIAVVTMEDHVCGCLFVSVRCC